MGRYLALLLVALGAGQAFAADAVGVAVLGLDPNDVPESLAAQLTDALRQRVAATPGVRMLAGKDLIEVKMVFGCDAELPTCMAQAGKALGADKLIYGGLKKSANKSSVTVALKLLDVKSAMVEKFVNDTVPKRELASANVAASAGRWFGQLLEVADKPTLAVSSDPSGAAIAIDGQSYGKTPASLRDLAPGSHTVVLSLAGRKSAVRTIDLRAGGAHEVTASLEPEVVARPDNKRVKEPPPKAHAAPEENPLVERNPEPLKNAHPGRTAKIVGGVLAGAGLVVGSVWLYSYLQGRDLETKPCATTTAMCQKEADKWGVTASGTGAAALALIGGGALSLGIGIYQAHKAARSSPQVGFIRKSLRVAPVLSTSGGGLYTSFEF